MNKGFLRDKSHCFPIHTLFNPYITTVCIHTCRYILINWMNYNYSQIFKIDTIDIETPMATIFNGKAWVGAYFNRNCLESLLNAFSQLVRTSNRRGKIHRIFDKPPEKEIRGWKVRWTWGALNWSSSSDPASSKGSVQSCSDWGSVIGWCSMSSWSMICWNCEKNQSFNMDN